jgi:hypothetical protein
MRPLLAVVAILKNEASSVRALLESVRGVADHITIFDTGSTDGTQDTINEWRATRGARGDDDRLIQGEIVPFEDLSDRKVIDFAKTRNRALELEATRSDAAVFTLYLSGDETLVNGAELRAFLENHRHDTDGAYRVTISKGTSQWPYPRVLRVDAKWRYRYPIHEMPFSPEGTTDCPQAPGEVIYAPTDPKRLFERMKTVDLPVLTVLADAPLVTHEDHLSRARALLHLAQTHENLALEHSREEPGSPWLSHQMAAMAFYWRRADLDGDPNEKHYSLFRYFDIAGKLGFMYTSTELCSRLEMLASMDPARPEVRYLIAMHASQVDLARGEKRAMDAVRAAREAREKPLPYPTDNRIEWLSLQIAAECAKKLKKGTQARVLAEQGLAAGGPREAFVEYLA